ncbi:hypothetical protein HanXRQr2_Chr05g0231511 [Helianthus annuus]|uniref:Uncharacterized protein n=1 Tax=Helianthus annuus TaxID=4232 RepID=A0A9K3NQ12_HELAN|nr:hypothetical protein HanXRQr2_Chr05g0231511 [Helianthus annuus]
MSIKNTNCHIRSGNVHVFNTTGGMTFKRATAGDPHPFDTARIQFFLPVVAVTFTGFPLVPSLKHTTITQLINKNHHIYSCFLCVELC